MMAFEHSSFIQQPCIPRVILEMSLSYKTVIMAQTLHPLLAMSLCFMSHVSSQILLEHVSVVRLCRSWASMQQQVWHTEAKTVEHNSTKTDSWQIAWWV